MLLDLETILRDTERAESLLASTYRRMSGDANKDTTKLATYVRMLVTALRESERRARLTPDERGWVERVRDECNSGLGPVGWNMIEARGVG